MKRLFLIVFILSFVLTCGFVATHAFPETLVIDTSEGDKELYVPDEYEELREAYIEMSKLYIEESIDLEKCIEEAETLLKLADELEEMVITLQETNQELIDELIMIINERQKKDLFQGYLGTYFQRGYTSGFNGGIEIKTIVKEKLIIDLGISLQSIQLSIGWRIF